MFGRKKKVEAAAAAQAAAQDAPKEKPTPAYLRPDYPYQAIGDPIADIDSLEDTGVVYEIKCPQCQMSIRSQGVNIKDTYQRLMAGDGCIGCGNKELVVKRVNMSKAPKPDAK